MARSVRRDATNLILTVRPLTAAGTPIGEIPYDQSGFAVHWRASATGEWTSITLAAGAVGVYGSGHWVHLGDGVHQLGLPNAAIVAGDRTTIRITTATHPLQYDAIDAVIGWNAAEDTAIDDLPGEIAEAVAGTLGSVRLTVQQQLTLSGSTDITITQGDDYTRTGIRLDLNTSGLADPDTDLSAYHLILAIKVPNDTIGYRLDILGDPGEHYAIFAPSSAITEDWPTGTFALLYRIEWDTNEYQTLGDPATLIVQPFDIEDADITDLATPE
jgi:hypothetical protein